MNIGLFLPLANPFATPEFLLDLGRLAEACQFHRIWAAEHVVLLDEYTSQYPYAEDGRIPMGGETGMLEPFTTLGFLAAATTRLRLGTGICLVPQRNPVYTAKEATSLDWLSNGRLDFGVGVGWLSEEFDAVAAPFERRGARCRSYLEVMRRLWCDPVSEYKDEFYELRACRQYPKPIQQPHPPLFFGGESDAALRRVADLGQGWYGFNLDPEEFSERLARLDTLLLERGRSRSDIEIVVSPYLKGCDYEKIARFREAGADQVVVLAVATDRDQLDRSLEELAESMVLPAQEL